MKTVQIRTMTTNDLALGLRLSRQAGWNQTGADWVRLLYFEPEGCFVAELDGCPSAPQRLVSLATRPG